MGRRGGKKEEGRGERKRGERRWGRGEGKREGNGRRRTEDRDKLTRRKKLVESILPKDGLISLVEVVELLHGNHALENGG